MGKISNILHCTTAEKNNQDNLLFTQTRKFKVCSKLF